MQSQFDKVCADSDTPALKSIILVSNVKSCCGLRLKIDPRPSVPLVYTKNGTLIGAMFHGVCKVCNAKYYYSYKEVDNKDNYVRIYNSPNNEKFFQVSSCTVFEKRLLHDITILYSVHVHLNLELKCIMQITN